MLYIDSNSIKLELVMHVNFRLLVPSIPIMPGGLGIPVGPKALGIWGPHSDLGTSHTMS